MSLIRLSVLKDTPYAPDAKGAIDLEDYTRRRRRGRMPPLNFPELASRNSFFRHYMDRAVTDAVAAPGFAGPVVVMVNGFLFDPKTAVGDNPKDTDNPHGRLYHFVRKDEPHEQRHHTASWPLGLGFDTADDGGAQGLAVALGWQSQPGFASSLINHFQNFYARAYENASDTAWVLVNVIKALADLLPDQPIDIVCHSLGARVVVRALAMVAKQDGDSALDPEVAKALLERIGRIIVLGGAEYVVEAQLMRRRLEAWNLASPPQVYNIVARENDVLDKLAENFGPRTFGNSQVIGHNGLDITAPAADWIDLQIDRRALQDWMADTHGIEVSGDRPGNVWDHWYYYTYRGNMTLYNNILRERDPWAIPALRAAGVPDGVPIRWWNFGD